LVRARLRENDYRRARELFLAGVTHEFKTPLASLRLYTETLDRPDLGDEERGRIRGLLVRDVQRMERLVGQVLTAARDRPSRAHLREPFDLSEEAEAVLRGMEGFLTRESARLVTELPRGRSVKGERAAFSIALRNLVENAVLHSPQPAEVRVTLSSESAWHRVSVRDRGPGIPRRHRRSIFRGFFRIEAEDASSSRGARGTGLGLYLVKRNAEALGGRVEVRSGSDGGSVFTLVLPAYFGGEAL
ncbi:MAG: HAMP domain-containing sensor histidine kinase, partial [Gemmatimonadota bacterium]|nr:HAMP domain-containing sensor histidine kinase [Gemmatimonadota bacterium]